MRVCVAYAFKIYVNGGEMRISCRPYNVVTLKPQSHRIVRFLDRTIERSAMSATISSSGRIPRLVFDDWSYA